MNDSALPPPRTREELFARIAKGGREEVTREEMIRLGFWSSEAAPAMPPEDAARLKELRARLDHLRDEAHKLGNLRKLAEEARKQRLAASRKRRIETKQRLLGEREAKKAETREKKTREITFLGERVSAGLGPTADRRVGDETARARHALPELADLPALASALGITLSQLRFLAYDREVSTVSHYARFRIPKRTGGERLISAPHKRLKAVQHWIYEHVLAKVAVSDQAHGFVLARSIVTNARPHVGAEVVINADLRDFFPSIDYRRVKGLFQKLGYAEEVATCLALLCTEADTVETELDGITYYVAQGKRHLPQGAPTSPAITNLLCRRLDKRLAGYAAKHGLVYTRYADDLTVSVPAGVEASVGEILGVLSRVTRDEGLTLHPQKVSVQRRGGRQEVTGIVVNERLSVNKGTLRRFRALLHQIRATGPEGKHWGSTGANVLDAALGFANYVLMVDPAKGAALKAQVEALRARR